MIGFRTPGQTVNQIQHDERCLDYLRLNRRATDLSRHRDHDISRGHNHALHPPCHRGKALVGGVLHSPSTVPLVFS